MAHYIFEGKLRAYICHECWDSVRSAEIRIYRHRDDQDVAELVEASIKRTFTVLSTGEADQKSDYLIATAMTDEEGCFRVEMDSQNYNGGAFEIDVRLSSMKGADPDKQAEVTQFTLTSLQPDWREEGGHKVAPTWEHYIASRYWCHLLARYGIWVICGQVVSTGTQIPLQGMKVRAYDRDWIQDDLLGDDTTNSSGVFHIYYTSSTFKQTPFSPAINVELTSGPDVYFEVEESGGSLVLDENPSEGRQAGRENVGHCFCITLEVGTEAPPYDSPWFTHIGNFHILWDINSATGKTKWTVNGAGGADWGFFGHTKLDGFCPKVRPGTSDPLFYRFVFVDPVTLVETPLTGTFLRKVKVGAKLVWWDPDIDGVFGWTTQSIHVAGSGATAPVSGGSGPVPDHIVEPDADGWIAVDQDALDNGFYGSLARIKTEKIVAGGGAPGDGAGNAPSDPKDGATINIHFETTTDPANPAVTIRQFFSANILVNNWAEVAQLDLQEFQSGSAGSCTGLTTGLTILYTADHELMDDWGVSISSAASGSGWSPPPGLPQGSTPRGGSGTHPTINIAGWPPCSYTVRLGRKRMLTDGENNDDWDTLPVTFCKT